MTRKYAKRGSYTSDLTEREQQIYDEVVQFGDSERDLALKFGVKKSTINRHLVNIYLKKGVNSQKELIIQHYKQILEGVYAKDL